MTRQNRRKTRNIFTITGFQFGVLCAVVTGALTSCIITIATFAFFYADKLAISSPDNTFQVGRALSSLLKNSATIVLITICILCAFLLFATLMGVTHRLSGPLFRFERSLDKMLKKELNESIQLREGDEGKNLAIKINDFNEDISCDIKEIRRCSIAVNNLINQYSAIGKAYLSQEDIDSIVAAIRTNNAKISTISSVYKVAEKNLHTNKSR